MVQPTKQQLKAFEAIKACGTCKGSDANPYEVTRFESKPLFDKGSRAIYSVTITVNRAGSNDLLTQYDAHFFVGVRGRIWTPARRFKSRADRANARRYPLVYGWSWFGDSR
jgi:hypothetical protein